MVLMSDTVATLTPPPLTPPHKGEGDRAPSLAILPPPCGEGLGVGVSERLFLTLCFSVAGIVSTPQPARAEMPSFFPEIEIDRASAKTEWPFTIDRGDLSCIELGKQRFVFFSEKPASGDIDDIVKRRTVVVSTNPMTWFASFEDRALYAPFKDLETLIKRLAPYEAMGTQLCEDAKAKKEN